MQFVHVYHTALLLSCYCTDLHVYKLHKNDSDRQTSEAEMT